MGKKKKFRNQLFLKQSHKKSSSSLDPDGPYSIVGKDSHVDCFAAFTQEKEISIQCNELKSLSLDVSETLGDEDTISDGDSYTIKDRPVGQGKAACNQLQSSSLADDETLGAMEDKDSDCDSNKVQKNESVKGIKPDSKAPWVNLFKFNRNQETGLKLSSIDVPDNVVALGENDIVNVESAWGYCLVGYFAAKFPGKSALLNLCNSWKVAFKYFVHESGWLVFKFENGVDRDKVMREGPYFVFGRLLMLKVMPECFEFDEKEIGILPIWIKLPGLPLDCWNQTALSKISSKVGKPIYTDELTASKGRISYARVLVEVDVAKEIVQSVQLKFPSGKIRNQKVVYEYLPKFCSHCKMFGHTVANCKMKAACSNTCVNKTVASATVFEGQNVARVSPDDQPRAATYNVQQTVFDKETDTLHSVQFNKNTGTWKNRQNVVNEDSLPAEQAVLERKLLGKKTDNDSVQDGTWKSRQNVAHRSKDTYNSQQPGSSLKADSLPAEQAVLERKMLSNITENDSVLKDRILATGKEKQSIDSSKQVANSVRHEPAVCRQPLVKEVGKKSNLQRRCKINSARLAGFPCIHWDCIQ